jgi:hypothetical protein
MIGTRPALEQDSPVYRTWIDNGYCFIRRLPSGEWAALSRMAFTVGIVVGLDETGYRCRWCYAHQLEALEALAVWDGTGNPAGPWLKQKGRLMDGRSVDRGPDDIGAQ